MNRFSLSLLAGVAVLSMASAASAADLLVRQQPSMPGFVDMGGGGGWDGAYVGGFVGYGWGSATDDTPLDLLSASELDLSGWTVGATLGANFTVAQGFVLGAAGDIAGPASGVLMVASFRALMSISTGPVRCALVPVSTPAPLCPT